MNDDAGKNGDRTSFTDVFDPPMKHQHARWTGPVTSAHLWEAVAGL